MSKNSIFLFLFFALVFVSCEDKLDINPEDSINQSLAFSSEKTATSVLLGAYSKLQDLDVYGAMPQTISEYMPSNVNFVGSFPTLQDIFNYRAQSSNSSVLGIWDDNYATVLIANNVIQSVPGMSDDVISASKKQELIGEAKFIRALVFLQLANLFSQPYNLNAQADGIPIPLDDDYLKGIYNTDIARSSVSEVYGQIISDLKDAVSGLADMDSNGSRASSVAAKALLSRVYLYMGEYDEALSYANEVLADSSVGLASNYSFFGQDFSNVSEIIFYIDNSSIDNGRTGSGGWANYYNPANKGGRGDCPFASDLLASFSDNDKRISDLTIVEGDFTYTQKWPDASNNSDDVPVIRSSEIALTKAEALVETKKEVNSDAIELLNEIRKRAGLDAYEVGDFSSYEQLLDAILDERRKELAFEGHRRMDLLRRGKALRANNDLAKFGGDRTILPIPLAETDVLPNVTQNAGY